MSVQDETFCRLCAESTPREQLIYSNDDVAINSEITTKMLWINVDMSNSDLPTSICFSCFDLLEKTWIFLQNVRSAQVKLTSLLMINKTPEDSSNNSDAKPLILEWLTDAGKPVDKDWEYYHKLKKEKREFLTETECLKLKRELSTHSVEYTRKIKREQSTKSSECSEDRKESSPVSVQVEENFGVNTSADTGIITEEVCNEMPTVTHESGVSDLIEINVSINSNLQSKSVVGKKLKGKRGRKKWYEYDEKQLDVSTLNTSWDDYTCKCAHCNEQCMNIAALQEHSIKTHSNCCSFRCLECDIVLSSFIYFISHARMHNKLLKYSCEYCNLQFSSVQLVKRHTTSAHKNVLSVICKNCGSRFETPQLLQKHVELYGNDYRKHTEELKKKYNNICEICNKEFKFGYFLTQHRTSHSERPRKFICHSCGKMFYTKKELDNHLLSHTDVRNYKCEMCPKTFRKKLTLQTHILWHTGKRPFVCEQCGKGFRTKEHLKSHSTTHTNLKPYECIECNKSFRLKQNLIVHVRQHTGERPYHCEYCQKEFTNFANFSKHNKRKHNKVKTDDKCDTASKLEKVSKKKSK